MQKSLCEIAGHLKNIILSDIPDVYAIKTMFTNVFDEESIQKGIIAYRDFLYRFCDYLIVRGDLHDKPKKIAHPFSDRVSLPSNYPFLHNMESVLACIGVRGRLNHNFNVLTVDGSLLKSDLGKAPVVKVIECFRCLMDNGFHISGIDLTENKVNLRDLITMEISYPENSAVLTGLQVMAKAREAYEGTGLYGVILRCDYRVIANDEPDSLRFLRDMLKAIPAGNRDFVLRMHQKYLDDGFQCTVNVVDEMCVRFFYLYKRKEVWSIIISANNGYELAIRAKHTDKYTNIVKQLHPSLQEKISKGYGCDKKRDPNSYCQGGCKGFRVSLIDSMMDISQDMFTWIDAESAYL